MDNLSKIFQIKIEIKVQLKLDPGEMTTEQFVFDVVNLKYPSSRVGSYRVTLNDLAKSVLFIASGDFTQELCAFEAALEKVEEEMQFSFYIATSRSLEELEDLSRDLRDPEMFPEFPERVNVLLDSDSTLSKLFQTYDEATGTEYPSWYGIDENGYICFEITRNHSSPPCPDLIIHTIKEFQKIKNKNWFKDSIKKK